MNAPLPKRRFLTPEVVQTSAMDCGPAALKCLLEGFGISTSYGRLREACQTDVDGTSIDTLEEVAVQLGLDAEQVMLPADHLLLPEAQALPALVVVRLPNGLTHFVVLWRRHGGWLQVMDPAVGRRWMSVSRLMEELYHHSHPVPAAGWREWAASEEFLAPLRRRLADNGLTPADIARLSEGATSDEGWHSLAALDAATRLVSAIVRAGGVARGPQARAIIERFYAQARAEPPGESATVPAAYWSALPLPPDDSDEGAEEQLLLRGVVLIRVRGQQAAPLADEETPRPPLSPDLAAALAEAPPRPAQELWRLMRADGRLTPTLLVATLFLESVALLVEALLFRGLLDLGSLLATAAQRTSAAALLLLFLLAHLLLALRNIDLVLLMGRRLETRLRLALLRKVPRLGDRYFRSRLTSDMADRSHKINDMRLLPETGAWLARTLAQLLLTTLAMLWLAPASAPLVLLATVLAVAIPAAIQPAQSERDMRVRSHLGALSRCYLDGLLGLVALRTHGAERAMRREHESLLVEWGRAALDHLRLTLVAEGVQGLVGFALAAWLVADFLARGAAPDSLLLLVYWALSLPALAQELTVLARRYPAYRNITLRLLEPLGAPEEGSVPPDAPAACQGAAAIRMSNVTVRAAGHPILSELSLEIAAGSHVAIVGPSGAGKSSLVGLLLGWHRPAEGSLQVDGEPLEGAALYRLRQHSAWVDPEVQLWNRSLQANLRYGLAAAAPPALGLVIEQAELLALLDKLPDGLQSSLGEGGALVSGGEGQRVRLGRAMLRPDVRLVILDEPFRGLDRERRRTLLARARHVWRDATLLCITHDVGETLSFERVLVVQDGQLVADGEPTTLAAAPDSPYRAMLAAEEEVRRGLWQGALWRRLHLSGGKLVEAAPPVEAP